MLATALAQGVPPVVTAVGTFPELCAEYDLGDPVPPDDPAALADALVRALTDPVARARAVAGMARARAELTWERTAQMTLDLYERALAGTLLQRALPAPDLNERCDARARRIPWHPERHAAPSPGSSRCSLCVLAAGRLRRGAASPPGTLAQLAGAGGCVSQQTALGCTPARGLDDARAVALSPDGKSLYVAVGDARERDGVQRRRRATACWRSSTSRPAASPRSPRTGCGGARALEGASAIAVSPDGLHVYVASATAGAVASFARQPNGSLVQLTGHRRLHRRRRATPGCDTAPAAGRRRRDRDLARRALRLRRRRHPRTPSSSFSRDAATGRLTAARRAPRAACAPAAPTARPSRASTRRRRSRSRPTGRRSTSPRPRPAR